MITKDWQTASNLLAERKVGVIPTDTIYGISCLAFDKNSVEKIYKIKQRDFNKPFIILIPSIKDLNRFGISITSNEKIILNKYWPGPVSIVLNVEDERYEFLHRGTKTLAFRLPDYSGLNKLLSRTGPLVSTSANISNTKSAKSIEEAIEIFKNTVDFYLDVGPLNNPPSKIIRIENGEEVIIRS